MTVLAKILRCGSSSMIAAGRPRDARYSVPFLLRETAPPVFVSLKRTVASPVVGSTFITLLASLFAKIIVPLSPAIGPSTLLPSQDHTTFHVCPAAITPGIAAVGPGIAGSGGGPSFACDACPARPPPMEKAAGGFLHFAIAAASPELCHDCWLWPRSNDEAGF